MNGDLSYFHKIISKHCKTICKGNFESAHYRDHKSFYQSKFSEELCSQVEILENPCLIITSHFGKISSNFFRQNPNSSSTILTEKHKIYMINSPKYVSSSLLTFPCSKSTIETLEKSVKYVQSNNKNTRTTSMTSFWCFY